MDLFVSQNEEPCQFIEYGQRSANISFYVIGSQGADDESYENTASYSIQFERHRLGSAKKNFRRMLICSLNGIVEEYFMPDISSKEPLDVPGIINIKRSSRKECIRDKNNSIDYKNEQDLTTKLAAEILQWKFGESIAIVVWNCRIDITLED